ncbi:MAG TPA: sensor histidine kinase [Streptosporangiaceae bacterium]|jgi:anti-sigma regulatory factor (Ser/Thr protein kinase)
MNRAGTRPPPPAGPDRAAGLRHQALLCRGRGDCIASVLAFIRDGLARAEPVSVGVSAGLSGPLRELLEGEPAVTYFDMRELGRNPGRIIPAMLDFAGAHAGGAIRYVSEPFWVGRSTAENAEVVRHEALLELAFAGRPVTVMCAYDVTALDPVTAGCAELTHPVIVSDGRLQSSQHYAGAGVVPAQCDRPLMAPPASATRLVYSADLRQVRTLVSDCAASAGLAPGRITDLALAASEVAANTLQHAGADGTLLIWHTRHEVVCQLTDPGIIQDPLAGRHRPDSAASGQGLWVVNQVCDLVQLRSGPEGTTVRMHFRLWTPLPAV